MLTNLVTVLKAYPHGIKEYDLLKQLEHLKLIEPTQRNNTFDLFQRHFLLFHSLYTLRDNLLIQQSYQLEIHCSNIRLWPYYNPLTSLPALYDPLRDYYLNLNNLQSTSESDVNDLLQQFWQRFDDEDYYHKNKESALKTLGLDQMADRVTIKKHLAQLRSEHHPDHGGDAAYFNHIEQAGKALLNYHKYDKSR